MLFRKNMPRSCNYCAKGTVLENGTVLCVKRGIVSAEKPCAGFKYDPCRRIPPKQKSADFRNFKDEDFSL